MLFKWRRAQANGAGFYVGFACLWDTNSEHYENKKVREIAAREFVQLNLTELTVENLQMKVRRVRC